MDNGQLLNPMKSQDILVLLKLVSLERRGERHAFWQPDSYSVRSLAEALGLSKSEVSNSIIRSSESGLVTKSLELSSSRVQAKALFEFLVYGLKYVFPAKPGPLARGMATSFAAPALKGKVLSGGSLRFVWPYAEGHDSGQSIEPLFKSAPIAAERDEELYAYLALVDAVRIGNPREAQVARDELEARMLLDD